MLHVKRTEKLSNFLSLLPSTRNRRIVLRQFEGCVHINMVSLCNTMSVSVKRMLDNVKKHSKRLITKCPKNVG